MSDDRLTALARDLRTDKEQAEATNRCGIYLPCRFMVTPEKKNPVLGDIITPE